VTGYIIVVYIGSISVHLCDSVGYYYSPV